MDTPDREVLQQALEWCQSQQQAWLVTVVATWGSAPRPPGAMLALRADGRIAGSVSGGCVENDLIDRIRHHERIERPQFITYGVGQEEAARFGLPCGGTLRLLQEPLAGQDWIAEVLERTGRHERVTRCLDLESGISSVRPQQPGDTFGVSEQQLLCTYGPRWRILLIGAGQLSRCLAQMARMLDFEVVCCDPREEYHAGWDVPDTVLTTGMPDDVVLQQQPDAHTAIVALTHDRALDDMALLEALRSDAFYVGALGSQRNQVRRRERLTLFDLSPQQIGRLHGPVGLSIGSRLPAEIALSVLAEIVAVRNGRVTQRPVESVNAV